MLFRLRVTIDALGAQADIHPSIIDDLRSVELLELEALRKTGASIEPYTGFYLLLKRAAGRKDYYTRVGITLSTWSETRPWEEDEQTRRRAPGVVPLKGSQTRTVYLD
ncbi:hypothetical protein ACN47E_002828 [Coniothyrium glycines]